ncbi:MAG: hypothetical protein Q9201_007456 [Fulgogasparrea decipioides]
MVRKPISPRPTSHSLPYPVTPTSPQTTLARDPASRTQDGTLRNQAVSAGSISSMSDVAQSRDHNAVSHDGLNELPPALRVGQDDSWRPGNTLPVPSPDLTPRSSLESQRGQVSQHPVHSSYNASSQQSNNPYFRMQQDRSNDMNPTSMTDDTSTAIWADGPIGDSVKAGSAQHNLTSTTQTSSSLASMLPMYQTSSQKAPFSEPWIDFNASSKEKALLSAPLVDQNSTSAWTQGQHYEHDGPRPVLPSRGISHMHELQELETQPFQNPGERIPVGNSVPESVGGRVPTGSPLTAQLPSPTGGTQPSYIRDKPLPSEPPGSDSLHAEEKAPDLPPRGFDKNQALPPPQHAHSAATTDRQEADAKRQRSETYQIRLVNWFDASSPVNPRTSPIMVQNANGPCPLLALVNALVLSTPVGVTTALVETLRVREQVSLGLLLDAVIDELMSGRRGDAAQALPDVSELYAFLVNLHTGMNVNPRFVEPVPAPTHLMDDPISGVSSELTENRKAGGFEDTPHMRLYSTFAVSLIHGWLPRKNHPVCAALDRSAKTYEDAQGLLFAEEELENKLQSQGLTNDEQRLLEDIASVKYFLTSSPTQLTDYGLDTITETLPPGHMAILFRNDHFSTLYKEPRSRRIFTLVTDLGYAGHDEVVWESLVDISGEGSEFFSGDFRPVGNNVRGSQRRSAGPRMESDDAGWTTVSRFGGHGRSRSSVPPDTANLQTNPAAISTAFSRLSVDEPQNTVQSPKSEQEDHDLALAMQLQEEEEDRQRQELAARRRREDELSRAYLDSNSRASQRGGRPQVPPRGGGRARQGPARRLSEGTDAPPPTYEQAAKGPAYHPPISNPRPTVANSSTNISRGGTPASRPVRQVSAYSQTSSAFADPRRPELPMRRPQAEDKKDCIVM